MYKNKFSSVRYINTGVLQGPVLGPLFYLLYVNAEKMRSICRLYADDHSLQQCSDDIYAMKGNLIYDLKGLYKWSKTVITIQSTENKSCIF